jgi:hypothetical protein
VNNASEQMRLTSTGLGIGTSSPRAKLDVSGSVLVGTYQTSTNYAPLSVKTAASVTTPSTFTNAINIWNGTTVGEYSNITFGYNTLGLTNAASYIGFVSTSASGNGKGDLVFGTRDVTTDTAATERMRLDSSGNLGLGVTPTAWTAGGKIFELGFKGNIFYGVTYTAVGFSNNAYYDATAPSGWKFANPTSSRAGYYEQSQGTHAWATSTAAGTAGNAITFTQAMTLDASGLLALGTTSPASATRLTLDYPGFVQMVMRSSGTDRISLYGDASVSAVDGKANPLAFYAGSAERARIDSSGNLLVGTTTQPTSVTARFVSSSAISDYSAAVVNTNASPFGLLVRNTTDVNSTGNEFLVCQGSTTLRASIRSNGGIANFSANDVNLSDRREKTNFAPAKSYLETICAIPVQTFNYIDQNNEEDPGLTLGVVAQDVQAVAPELVMESDWGTKDDPKMRLSIYQTDLQYALMKALQELKAEFDAYKSTHP